MPVPANYLFFLNAPMHLRSASHLISTAICTRNNMFLFIAIAPILVWASNLKNCKSRDSVRLCGMPPLGKRHFHLQENGTLQFKHAHFSDFSIYVQSQGHALMLASRELDSLAAKWSERKRNTLHQNKQTLTCRQKSETSPRRVQKFTSSWNYSSRHKTQN